VSPVPEVHIHTRTSSDVALVIATDGVWDEIDNDEAGIIFDSALAAGTQARNTLYGAANNDVTGGCINSKQVEEDELEPVDETEEMMVTCARIADEYVRTALMKGSFDNMAVLVVRLDTAHTVSRQLFV
jgi:serine/threonine protein phosphatase PrpC